MIRIRRRNRRVGSLVGFFISLTTFGILLIVCLFIVFPSVQARLSGVKTLGVVQDISDCNDSSGGGDVALRGLVDIQDNVQPTIQFTDLHGQSHTVDDGICGDYGIGEQVVLWYLPSNPNAFSLEDDGATLVVLSALTGGVGLVALFFLLIFLGRLVILGIVSSRAGGQNNVAYAASPAPMGGWQMNSPPMMGSPPPMMGSPSFGANGHHRLGEAVHVGGQWAVTVMNAYPSQGAEMVSAAPGRYYLLLTLTLRNTSREPMSFSQTTFRLSDHVGAEYLRAPLLEGQTPGFVQPGDQVSATLAYDVPGAQRQFQLNFYLATSSLAQATWDIAV